MRLDWIETVDDIGGGRHFVSGQPWIEHSVGPAHYSVAVHPFAGWSATWFHGNRGHDLGQYATLTEAQAACRSHLQGMADGILRINHYQETKTDG